MNRKGNDCGSIDQIDQILENSRLYAESFLSDGAVSSYIPALAAADSSHIAGAVMLPDGACYKTGDSNVYFTIQSISKVISYMYALQLFGYDGVTQKVNVEPSGDPFNCFIKLETAGERPFNPFINAGAITVISMLADKVQFKDALDFACKIFGSDEGLNVDTDVFNQEMQAGKRNRSMAYLMSSKGVLGEDVEAYLNFYYCLCAIKVNVTHIAHMGSVLANSGVCPKTGKQIVPAWITRVAKAVMLTCGLYDGSGEFAVNIGIPAKSGIAGGIVAAAGGIGIGTYSPALDTKGNSVGGTKILQSLSKQLNLNLFS